MENQMDNKYGTYRKIRYDRTYRPLGKMTWWRVVLGIVLLILVFLLSGAVSQGLAFRGHFKAARALMISPSWVERYKPELKAFIDAGVLYEDGEYDAAAETLAAADPGRLPKPEEAFSLAERLLEHYAAQPQSEHNDLMIQVLSALLNEQDGAQ